MLDEEEAAPGPKYATHFGERTARIGDAAERPGRHYGVHAPIFERQRFRGALDQLDRTLQSPPATARHREQPCGRIEPDHLLRALRIKRQIESGADPDFEDAALCVRKDPLALGGENLPPHRQMNQMGEDMILVEAHLIWTPMFPSTSS